MDLPLFSGVYFMDSWIKMDLGNRKHFGNITVKASTWVIKTIRIILKCVFVKY